MEQKRNKINIFTSNNIFGTSCCSVCKTIQMMNSSNSSSSNPPFLLHFDL